MAVPSYFHLLVFVHKTFLCLYKNAVKDVVVNKHISNSAVLRLLGVEILTTQWLVPFFTDSRDNGGPEGGIDLRVSSTLMDYWP